MSHSPSFSYSVALACVVLLMAAASAYHAGVRMPRPAVGVYNGADILIMSLLVIVTPVIYAAVTGVLVSIFFGLVCYAALQVAAAPLVRGRLSWAVAAGLCAADVLCTELGSARLGFFVNDAVIGLAVIGVTNLWVQSGMRSGHIAWFAGFLAVYDLVATWLTSSTADFIQRVSGIPFSPEWVFTSGPDPVAIGLGDLLLLCVFPLAVHRSFGIVAAVVAMAAGTAVTVAYAIGYRYGVLHGAAPVLTVLGPLVVIQHHVWRHVRGRERTTGEWRGTARATDDVVLEEHDVAAADKVPMPEGTPGSWVAIAGTRVVGVASTPGAARRRARENGCAVTPQVREIPRT